MTLLADFAIRTSVVLAAGLLATRCLAGRSAALRHRVLAITLVAAVLVGPIGHALPEWHVTVPAMLIDADGSDTPAPASDAPRSTATMAVVEPGTTTASVPVPELAWLAGMLACVSFLMLGLLRIGRVAARARRVEDPRWHEVLRNVGAGYGLRRAVGVARTDTNHLLATWGIVRPQVLLPMQATDWSLDRVRIVLCHELAHIRRHDWAVQMGAEGLRAILWFNPLAWIVCARLRRESEQACDDEVIGAGVRGEEYAPHLIELARECRRSGPRWAPALPMAHVSTLERRIAAMLNPQLDRRAPSRRAMAALVATVLAVTLPVAALRARQDAPAAFTGTVYDVSGGALPGVELSLSDPTGVVRSVRSSGSGRFVIPSTVPGTYVLEASLPGFRTLREEIELRTPADWTRALTLQVGDVASRISIMTSRGAPRPQPSVPAAPQPVRVGGAVRAPEKTHEVQPVYPATMRDAGLTGVVPIEAIIQRDGTVSAVRVVSAQVHPDFALAAADAVRQWRFTPTLLNGRPVEVMMMVHVEFAFDD